MDRIKKNILVIILFAAVFLFQMGMMLPYALYQCRTGLCGYWFPNISAAHDDSWTMAIASVAFESFPFKMPLYAGAVLKGYHFIAAFFIKILSFSGVSFHTIFYGVVPLIWLILISKILLILASKISKNRVFSYILIFLFFFGGSFSYFLTLSHKLPFLSSPIMTGRQAIDYFQSMPLAISLIPFLLAILYVYIEKKLSTSKKIVYLIGVIFLAWGSKFYAGVAVATMLGTFELLHCFNKWKKTHFVLLGIIIFASFFTVLLFYNPLSNQKSTKEIFIFSPFATVNPIIEERNLLYFPKLALARYSLQEHGWGPRLMAIELYTWTLYITYTFGIRIIGFIYVGFLLVKKRVTIIDLALLASVTVCLLGGTMFVQSVEWWNTVQFLDYPKVILSIYAALGISQFLERKSFRLMLLVGLLIVLLSIHNSVQGFIERASFRSAVVLSQNQINALNYLKKQPSGVVFALPYDRNMISNTNKIEDGMDPVYIPIISQKVMYFTSPYILDLTATDYTENKAIVEKYLFSAPHLIDASYFYINKFNKLYSKVKFDRAYFRIVYENSDVVILKKRAL